MTYDVAYSSELRRIREVVVHMDFTAQLCVACRGNYTSSHRTTTSTPCLARIFAWGLVYHKRMRYQSLRYVLLMSGCPQLSDTS